MKFRKLFLAALVGSVLVSCSDDDDPALVNPPLGAYQNGIFVLNEGNSSAGSVTFISSDFSLVKQDIFGAENEGEGLGGYLQSMFFDDQRAFIISGGSNILTVVDRNTFKQIAQITTGFSNPRYGVVAGGKAYITNHADFGDLTDDYITVVDLSNYQVQPNIPIGAIGEKIFVYDGKLFVVNGTYGNGNTIKVISLANGSVVDTIDLPQSPNSCEAEDGKLFVLTADSDSPSHLVRINMTNNEVERDITFPSSLGSAQNLNIENGKFYFSIGNQVFDESVNTNNVADTPMFNSAAVNLYGMRVSGFNIYLTDAKDYVSDGQLLVYSIDGSLWHEPLLTGLIPNSVYFN